MRGSGSSRRTKYIPIPIEPDSKEKASKAGTSIDLAFQGSRPHSAKGNDDSKTLKEPNKDKVNGAGEENSCDDDIPSKKYSRRAIFNNHDRYEEKSNAEISSSGLRRGIEGCSTDESRANHFKSTQKPGLKGAAKDFLYKLENAERSMNSRQVFKLGQEKNFESFDPRRLLPFIVDLKPLEASLGGCKKPIDQLLCEILNTGTLLCATQNVLGFALSCNWTPKSNIHDVDSGELEMPPSIHECETPLDENTLENEDFYSYGEIYSDSSNVESEDQIKSDNDHILETLPDFATPQQNSAAELQVPEVPQHPQKQELSNNINEWLDDFLGS